MIVEKKTFSFQDLDFEDAGPPRYEQLARFIERTIRDGALAPGDRLPTVRQLAGGLGVSATTISSAFELLTNQGLIRPEVGRGTFVTEPPKDGPAGGMAWRPDSIKVPLQRVARVPWRRCLFWPSQNRASARKKPSPPTLTATTSRLFTAALIPKIPRAERSAKSGANSCRTAK